MPNQIRVVIVEDRADDAELMIRELRRAGFQPRWKRVETEDDYLRCLAEDPEVILADSCLPEFDGMRALDILQQRGLDIPLLLVSGRLGEDVAVEAMKRGAYDYLLKDRLTRLGEAVRRALERRRLSAESARATAALRRSEEHYRLISEVTTDYAYTLSAGPCSALRCEWTTEAFPRITGFTADEINARGWISLYHADDRQAVEKHLQTLLSGKPDVAELRTVTKGGEVRWVRVFGQPVRDGDEPAVVRIYGAAQDITTNRNLEQQLLQAQKMEAIGRLAGGVAHDFNNLLTIISGYGGLLKDGFMAGKPSVENLDPILRASERAAQLTRQLLAFSRRQVLKLQPVDLNRVVGEVEKMLHRVIGEDIELRTVLGAQMGTIQADSGQIEQVIVNLAVNARDAMPDGGKLTIETANVEWDDASSRQHAGAMAGSYVMLSVCDSGMGMSKETQARIFEPFFTTKEMGKGTGLGLATVYGIVKQSGGNIWVDSEPGQGTVFKVYFPKLNHAAAEPAPTVASPARAGSETILVVEDETAVRTLVCRILERQGYSVLQTGEADEALRLSREHPGRIGLLLTDIVMPHMSGPDLAESVCRIRPEIRVLYTSGYTDNTVVTRGVARGGMAFFEKPFTPDALARRVREVLDAPACHDSHRYGATPSPPRRY